MIEAKGPPRCQKHGTTSRPLLPAERMITVDALGVSIEMFVKEVLLLPLFLE
jgi:hypothetical protein